MLGEDKGDPVRFGRFSGFRPPDVVHHMGCIGMMAKTMEATVMGYIGYILGLYRDNGKENGSYYLGFRV